MPGAGKAIIRMGINVSDMKIILIGTTAASVLNFRSDLISALISKGFTVYAMSIDYCDVTREQVSRMGAFPVDYKFSRAGLNPVANLLDTLTLSKIIKTISPNIVFSYFSKPVVFGTLAAKLAGVSRCIGMIEGLGYTFTDCPSRLNVKKVVIRRVQVLLYWFAFRFLERLIFLNKDDPKDLLGKYKLKAKNVSVLGGIGLDLQNYPYTKPPAAPISFIFVGRLLAEKGICEFVSAARLIKLEYPDVKFHVLGGVDESNPGGLSYQELDELVRTGTVTYPGYVTDVRDWLNRSSVFVLPSYYREGVPRSTQEAMAVGRAVITTDMPGCRETVVDGVNGFMVPPRSVPDLVEKMRYFVENPAQIEIMGLESLAMAKIKFNVEEINARLIRYFI